MRENYLWLHREELIMSSHLNRRWILAYPCLWLCPSFEFWPHPACFACRCIVCLSDYTAHDFSISIKGRKIPEPTFAHPGFAPSHRVRDWRLHRYQLQLAAYCDKGWSAYHSKHATLTGGTANFFLAACLMPSLVSVSAKFGSVPFVSKSKSIVFGCKGGWRSWRGRDGGDISRRVSGINPIPISTICHLRVGRNLSWASSDCLLCELHEERPRKERKTTCLVNCLPSGSVSRIQ